MGDPPLATSLSLVSEVLRTARDPWWIIGSAAVALHGGDAGYIADIDVIVSRRDLDALYDSLPLTDTPDDGKTMFRSQRFGRWAGPALDVEFMTGLEVLANGAWEAVEPRTRIAVQCGEATLYLPERFELIAILRLFGREKDLARAATILNQ
ncbi:hypothetical protein [Altererythrobacter sp. GH1-8]|uniref:hypothetical protein n=1 Tax=Altererythrobacter sp. GH1-8 TaxID=3349333 RepID=UPI00374D2858